MRLCSLDSIDLQSLGGRSRDDRPALGVDGDIMEFDTLGVLQRETRFRFELDIVECNILNGHFPQTGHLAGDLCVSGDTAEMNVAKDRRAL